MGGEGGVVGGEARFEHGPRCAIDALGEGRAVVRVHEMMLGVEKAGGGRYPKVDHDSACYGTHCCVGISPPIRSSTAFTDPALQSFARSADIGNGGLFTCSL